ncbi:MAG: hypothetical protein ACYDH2_14820 [Anaerolineaceae bacterium]
MKTKRRVKKVLRCERCGIQASLPGREGEKCPISDCRGRMFLVIKNTTTNPLRKVLGNLVQTKSVGDYTWEATMEVLECGHLQLTKKDIYGEYWAARRRCLKCGQGIPPDLTPQEIKGYQKQKAAQ